MVSNDSPVTNLANLPSLKERHKDSHKGNYGKVVVIGGSAGMAGAVSLSALAALRMGTGLIKVAVPDSIQPQVAAFNPCYMTIACTADDGCFALDALDPLGELTDWADAIAIGPGLGESQPLQHIVTELYQRVSAPMIVDADALNALAKNNGLSTAHNGPRILTPHAGEFARLAGASFSDRDSMEAAAETIARDADVTIVLKGHQTLVTNGRNNYRNRTGNPGMATGGSGDVLTGIITSLTANQFQELDPFSAAVIGVHLHGRAGDLAAETVGQTSLIATDIVDALPSAIMQHKNDAQKN